MQIKLNNLFNKLSKEKYDKYLELVPDFKKEKTQKFTTIVLTLIAIIILSIFAINPTLSTIANLRKQAEDAKFVKEKLDQKISNLSLLQTKYNSIRSDLPIIYESIPQKSEVPKLTGQIQSIAQKSNLLIVSFQATEINPFSKNILSYYPFNISAKGNYQNIMNFLNQLITMQRIVTISNISINQISSESTDLQANIKGLVFFKQ